MCHFNNWSIDCQIQNRHCGILHVVDDPVRHPQGVDPAYLPLLLPFSRADGRAAAAAAASGGETAGDTTGAAAQQSHWELPEPGTILQTHPPHTPQHCLRYSHYNTASGTVTTQSCKHVILSLTSSSVECLQSE